MADPDADSHELGADKQTANAAPKSRTSTSGKKSSSEGKQSSARNEKENTTADNGDENEKITETMINTIRSEQKRTGVSEKAILSRLHTKAKKIEDLTVEEFNQVMKIFQVTKDLKQEAADGNK